MRRRDALCLSLAMFPALLAAQGTEVVTGTSQEFREVVRDSMAKNALVVKAA